MKVYFTAAISAKDQFGKNYKAIVETLRELGHKVSADHILKRDMSFIKKETDEEHKKHYKWMVRELSKADLLIAEVSFPSTVHVGHELTLALEKDKPVLALYTEKRKPLLFWGITSEKFYVAEYNLRNIKSVLEGSIDYLAEQMDARFNFFISPKIGNYLDWIAKKRKMPRAVYLRRLIEKDMVMNKKYKKS